MTSHATPHREWAPVNTEQKINFIKGLALKMGWLIKYVHYDSLVEVGEIRFNFVDYNGLEKVLLKQIIVDEASLQAPVNWQLSEMCSGKAPRAGSQYDLEFDFLKDELNVHDGYSDFLLDEGTDLEIASLLDSLLADLSEDQIRAAFAAHEEKFYLLGKTSTWDNPNAVLRVPGHPELHGAQGRLSDGR